MVPLLKFILIKLVSKVTKQGSPSVSAPMDRAHRKSESLRLEYGNTLTRRPEPPRHRTNTPPTDLLTMEKGRWQKREQRKQVVETKCGTE